MVVVAMLGCAGVYAWWSRARRPVAAHEQSAPVSAAVRPAAAAVPAATPRASQPPPASHPAVVPANAASSLPQPPLNPKAAVRVQMTAAEPVWVSVKCDGKNLFAGVLEANQSRAVDANAAVVLVVGNAGGMSILLNGKPIGPLGPKGEVRNVQLTSGGFVIVDPRAPASLEPM